MRGVLICALVLCSFGFTQIPAQPAGTGSIKGLVIAAAANRPVAYARVVITGGQPRASCTVTTQRDGAFACERLTPGDYQLVATRVGYLETQFGQIVPGSGRAGTPIRLAAGQQINNLRVPLARGGAVSGAVIDDIGEPAFGSTVRAYRWVMSSGERTLQSAATAIVDDRGTYRLPLLPPGEYIVGVPSRTGIDLGMIAASTSFERVMVTLNDLRMLEVTTPQSADANSTRPLLFAPSYYSGATRMNAATTLTIGPSDDLPNIDLRLDRVASSRISGVVIGPDGTPARVQVSLIDASMVRGLGVRTVRSGADGRFEFTDLAPGTYRLVARGATRGGATLEASGREAVEMLAQATAARAQTIAGAMSAVALHWADAEVTVDGRDVSQLSLTLQPGITLSGRVTMEGGAALPAEITRMTVGVSAVGVSALSGEAATTTPAPVDVNGRFTIRGVMPGLYRVVALGGVPSGFTLASSTFAGRDTLDVPLAMGADDDRADGLLVLSSRTTEISGTVRDASSRPAPAVTIVVFSTDEREWTPGSRRIQGVRPSIDGQYRIRGLPPGAYRITTVADVEPGRWFDPEWLRARVGEAMSIRIGAGEMLAQDLRIR